MINPADISKFRSQPQAAKLWLSVYRPETVLAARVNDATISVGARVIEFDEVTSGSYLNIKPGMTMYVGTTLGARDKGKIRVRSATSSDLLVAENSHIDWSDNDYLTVVNFVEINPVYPRIVGDLSNPTEMVWYKDYDIEYTNQNSALGSFICMGSHRAGFVGDGFHWSASGTFNLKDEALSYHWEFPGGSITGSSAHTPGTVSWNTPGHYAVSLCVSGTSSSDVSYRYVSVYDRPGQGSSWPVLAWELDAIAGSRPQGGYSVNIITRQDVPIYEGDLVVIFSETWYGDLATPQTIEDNIFFVGYIMRGSIQYDYRQSTVSFDVGSPTVVMKAAEGFSVSVKSHPDPDNADSDPDYPSNWIALLDMDIRRAVYHYLRWHSTILLCADIEFIGTDRKIQYYDADRTSLYDAVNTLLRGAWFGTMVNDRKGKLWAERDLWLDEDLFSFGMTIEKQDWMETPTIQEELTPSLSWVQLGGIAYSGSTTGTSVALLSAAPGVSPGYRGTAERLQGLALVSQEELNKIAGLYYASKNVPYPDIDIKFVGNYQMDIAPQQVFYMDIPATDTVRGQAITGSFHIDTVSWDYDPDKEFLRPSVVFSQHPTTFSTPDGQTLDIPVPEEIGSNYQEPAVQTPSLPPSSLYGGLSFPAYLPCTVYVVNGNVLPTTPTYALSIDMPPATTTATTVCMTPYFSAPRGYSGLVRVIPLFTITDTTANSSTCAKNGTMSGTLKMYTAVTAVDLVPKWNINPVNPNLAFIQTKNFDYIVTAGMGTASGCAENGVGLFEMEEGALSFPISDTINVQLAVGRRTQSGPGDTYPETLNFWGWKVEWA